MFGISMGGSPFTMSFLCSKFKPPKLICPNLMCHNRFSCFTSTWKFTCVTTTYFLRSSCEFIDSCACAPSFCKSNIISRGTFYCFSSEPLQSAIYVEAYPKLCTHHFGRRHCSLSAWAVQHSWDYVLDRGQSKHLRCISSPSSLLGY